MADIVLVPATILPSSNAVIVDGIAGATIVAGQVIYLASDSTLKLADSDGTSPANSVAGIALGGAGSGQKIFYVIKDPVLTIFTASGVVNSGDTIWLSDTAGGMTKLGPNTTSAELETGDVAIVLGVALGTTGQTGVQTMNFSPIVGGVI